MRFDIKPTSIKTVLDVDAVRMQPPPQASPGFLRMLEEALHAEEHGKPFGGA